MISWQFLTSIPAKVLKVSSYCIYLVQMFLNVLSSTLIFWTAWWRRNIFWSDSGVRIFSALTIIIWSRSFVGKFWSIHSWKFISIKKKVKVRSSKGLLCVNWNLNDLESTIYLPDALIWNKNKIALLRLKMKLYNILGSPEIDPSDAAQSCGHKTRNNDMVRISAHKFPPSKII